MMLGTLLIFLLVNCCTGFHIKHREAYPGFTVFDDKHGNYMRVIGPSYLKVDSIHMTRPPYNLANTVKLSLEVTPTIPVYNIFMNGTVNYNNAPFWTYDGVTNHCMDGRPRFNCPMIKNKKESYQAQINLLEAGMVPGRYTLAVDAATNLPGGKRLHLIGLELGMVITN